MLTRLSLFSELHATVGIGHKILDTDPEKDLEIYGINWEDSAQRISTSLNIGATYVLFQEDVQKAISGCMNIYDNWDDLPQELQHVLVNMCFQLGKRGSKQIQKL